jgi:hypothetical protein
VPINGLKYPCNARYVPAAPVVRGVYALHQGNELIYYGSSDTSIRARLISHMNGWDGPCTRAATHFQVEPCVYPAAREAQLLAEYRLAYRRLPRCNDRMP